MADLTPRIEKLVDGLAGRRGCGAGHPTGGSPPELRPGDGGFAEAVAQLVAMSLDQYAGAGAPLEIRVPWCRGTLWFVPAECDAERLSLEGVSRGRVWTARELSALMALPDRTPEIVQSLALAKRTVDGDIVEVRPTTHPRSPTAWTSGSAAR